LPFSLSPVTTVGLIPNALPIALGGRTETFALRWDAEWSAHVFTALEYQHQDIRNLDLPIAETFDTLSIGEAKVDRVAATANLWLGYGIGVFGTVGAAASEVREGLGVGRDVPYVPGRFARAGLTFVHPSRVKFTMAQTFNGDLAGDLTGQPLKDYWTTEAAVSWETPDRHLLFEMTVLNLFDLDYELAPHIPGPGRTVAASLHARF
jgi:outer membrane receptor protein involved in Fe transport